MKLTERDIELIKGIRESYLNHAARSNRMQTRMGDKQYEWDMEKVELLSKILMGYEKDTNYNSK